MLGWKESLSLLGIVLPAAVGLFSLWWQKHLERLAINRAVLGEVSRLVAVIRRHRHWWRKERKRGDPAPLIPFSTDVYDKLTDKLGYLDPEIVAPLANFYGFVKFLNEIQKTRDKYADTAAFEELYGHNLDVVAEAYYQRFDGEFDEHRITRPDEQPIVGGTPTQSAPAHAAVR